MSKKRTSIFNVTIFDKQHDDCRSRASSNASSTLSNSIYSINNDVSSKKVYLTSEIMINVHSKKRNHRICFASALSIIIVIIIAVLIVCLRTLKPDKLCYVNIQAVIHDNSSQHSSHPYSLVAADFNHDKFLDIVVVNSGTNSIGIFINYGNNTFASQMSLRTEDFSRPLSAAVGDFNNDSHIDIAVANYDAHNIEIFLGHGDGNFSRQTTFSTGASRPVSISVGDLNNDHWLDIIITNNGTNDISIFVGFGNGYFGNQTTYSTGYDSLPYSVVVADLNNDQNLDIIVANYGTGNVGIFLGYGNGNFTRQTIYSMGPQSNPFSIAVHDLNNDGQLDIAVANSGTNNVNIFFGYGNGSFRSQITYSITPGSRPTSIIIGDFNQDNKPDIAVSNYLSNNISILIGHGDGTFTTPTMHSTGINSRPFGITVGDFDNNNQSDIAVANFDANNIMVLIGYRLIQSQNPTVYSTGEGSQPMQIASGDFNNDTHLDLAVVNSVTNTIGVFLGYENGSFQEQVPYSTGNNSVPYALAVNDLDNDQQLDIVVANFKSESIGILYGYGNGTFATVVSYFTGKSSSLMWVIVNDFNNDNHQDIAFADLGTNSIGIFLGYGNRSFKNLMTYFSGDNTRPLSIVDGDFNNDGQLDIAAINFGPNTMSIFIGFGNGTFQLLTTYSIRNGSSSQAMIAADLNNDNYLDIIVTNTGTDSIGIFFGFGNGSFDNQLTYSTNSGSSPYWISVADFNNDHSLDLAVANHGSHNVGVFLGNHQGYFGSQTTYSTGSGSAPNSIAVGDFNKDNRLDIAVANYGTSNMAILLGHSSENPLSQRTSSTDTYFQPFSAPVDNFNHENQLNSTLANWINDNVPILLGDYYADFQNQITYSTGSSSHPYSVAVGDFNNDERMDIVVANSENKNISILFGYNNEPFASETIHFIDIGSSSRYVIIADFNNDNQSDVAVSKSTVDSIAVLLGNGNGTFLPEITYSTDSGSNPGTLAIGNFDNDKYLDLVVTNQGTNTIGIFFGFDYTAFARQNPPQNDIGVSPYFVVTGDYNNDGYLDIVSALYESNNIGIFLGYGNGTFTSITTYADVPSSRSYTIAVGDFNNDNQLDITVAYWGINHIGIVLGNGDGTFRKPILYTTGPNTRPLSIAVGDFNKDNYLDITTANYGGNSIGVFLGYGNGTFQDVITLSTGENSGPMSVTVSDINNDTQPDIIVATEVTNNVGIFLGYGNGSFSKQLTTSTGTDSAPWYAIAYDFNKDGRLDLATADHGRGSVSILYGYGNGSFRDLQTYPTGTGSHPIQLGIYDFNNDNQVDIIVAGTTRNGVGIFFGYGDGTFASMSTIATEQDSVANSIVAGDFNGDKRLDFIIADDSKKNIEVFLSHSNKPFGGQTTFFVGEDSRPSSLAIGHFNNDTHLDIAVTNYGANNISIFFGSGNRNFSNIITYSTGKDSHPSSIAKGDFNNDSLTDVVVANSETDDIVVFLAYGNGSFSTFISYSMGPSSQPMSIAVGDFNRDYQLDIAVANYGTNNVCVLYGIGNGTFTNQTSYALDYNSRPTYVTFKDLNNDGREDILVATYGTDNVKILSNSC